MSDSQRVLVVEDDAAIRSVLVSLLEDEGYQSVEAEDGAEALDRARSASPDLIILDLLMPVMNGWAFLEASRTLPGCATVPILVTSASHEVPVDERIRAFLKKPFDLDLLAQTVSSLLEHGAPTAPAG